MADLHPDFIHAHPARKWTGPLANLRAQLDREADQAAHSRSRVRENWCFRILPHGACVAARRTGRVRTIRISRSSAPAAHAVRKWETELTTFVRVLRLERWEAEADRSAPGVAMVFSCDVALLCPCGAKVDENAQLFGDVADKPRCSACQVRQSREGVA